MKLRLYCLAALCLLVGTMAQATDTLPPNGKPGFVADYLQQLSPSQRENAEITLILPRAAGSNAVELKERVEALWNGGDYDTAIKAASGLAALCDESRTQVSIRWRVPEVSGSSGRWASDIRIGSVERAYRVDMAVDPNTGHIFCGVLNWTGSYYEARVFMSADGGLTWSSPSVQSGTTMYHDISVAVAGPYCFSAFDVWGQTVWVMRRSTADNTPTEFPGGELYVTAADLTPPQTVGEIELESAYEWSVHVLDVVLAVGVSGPAALEVCYGWNGGSTWEVASTNNLAGSAIRGLDMCLSGLYGSGNHFYVSYMDAGGVMRVGYLDDLYLQWHSLISVPAGYLGKYTAIGAYGNYVYCAFEYHDSGGTGRVWCKRGISQNGGINWTWAALSGDSGQDTYAPDVTLAGGSGQAVVYSQDMFMAQRIYTFWQPYGELGLPSTVQFGGGEPDTDKPDIENLGGGEYGIVYIRYDRPLGGVYFDHGSECCQGIRGDIDGAGEVNVSDLTYLVGYLFQGGAMTPCLDEADVDASGDVNVSDLTYVVAYLFQGGPAPAACD